jgi:hypothetical protein
VFTAYVVFLFFSFLIQHLNMALHKLAITHPRKYKDALQQAAMLAKQASTGAKYEPCFLEGGLASTQFFSIIHVAKEEHKVL